MATKTDTNKKLPNVPTKDTGSKSVAEIETFQGADGHGFIKYHPADISEAEQYSFEELWSPMGSFKTTAAHKKVEVSTSLEFEGRHYNVGGSARTYQTHSESYVGDTRKDTTAGDHGVEIGRNRYVVAAGTSTEIAKDGSVKTDAGGASEAPTFYLSAGDLTENRDGHYHSVYKKDKVSSVNGNEVKLVKEGDYARHVQKGNWDTKVSKKAKFFSGTDLLIQSATKITLRVGTSSIVITPSKIEVIAQNSSGIIDLNPGGSGSGTGNPSETA